MNSVVKIFLIVTMYVLSVHVVLADTSFTFSVPEGQGAGNNEFYHGRCVMVDVLLDTDGHATGGADLEINYDNTRITIVNNNCSTVASTIYHDSQYQNYTNNHVTSNKITLGAYNNPGVQYNGSGRFASFYIVVLDGGANYDLDFEFVAGNTTDTNLAETGTGNDILDHADNYTISFADDDDIPYINNLNPASDAIGISVVSNILYRLNDDDAGINFSTLSQSLSGTNWGTTNYTASSGQITHNCHITNANRVPYCDSTLNPANNLHYCEKYIVLDTILDLGDPIVHPLSDYSYIFDTESDNDASELYNLNPSDGSVGVGTTSNVAFDLRDIANPGGYAGTGIDISTLNINVSAPGWGSQTYTTSSSELTTTPAAVNDYGNVYIYNISIDPITDFPENTLVTIIVDVDDYGCPTTNAKHQTYTFTTADTIGPVCTLFTPVQSIVNMGTADDITFHCTDDGVGVDINTIMAIVDNNIYTATGVNQFTYSGTPEDYFITINPVEDFLLDYALEVIVNARDFSDNAANQESFGLATGVSGTCQTCSNCEECEERVDEKKCDEEAKIITKYETCKAIEKIVNRNDKISGILQAGSNIANTQLSSITLTKINQMEVSSDATVSIIVRDDIIIFEGGATPNTKVTLMIESEPLIVTGLSNDDGYWRIEMANIFPDGVHQVSAVTMSRDDYIIKSKFLADFTIKRWKIGGCPWLCWIIIIILVILCCILFYKYKKLSKKVKKLEKTMKT